MQPEHSNRPSTQFIKRGAIAIAIVAIILIVQTAWFQRIVFHKKKSPLTVTTVGDIVSKDSNGNGIEDWEERLWGLDPTVLYTNGVPNAQIIADKKKSLGIQEESSREPTNDTDRLARELFILASALGQSDEVDSQTLSEMSAKLAASIDLKTIQNQYSLKDVQTVQTSIPSLTTYKATLTKTLSKYNLENSELDVLINALENEDPSVLPQLTSYTTTYQKIARDLISIKVPVGLARQHLALANSFSGMATSFTYMNELNDNSIISLVGVAVYKNYDARLANATAEITAYLAQYGIL